ncbi:MAG: SMC-Scp complex subunit ScpB [bacterium]
MNDDYQKQVVEAMIFASDSPLSENKISACVEGLSKRRISEIVEELNSDYSKSNRAFFITRVAAGFQFNSHKEFAPWIKKLYKGRAKPRLSQAALESLAIITFKQPIAKSEVDAIRGVNSGGVIKNLLERNLVCISGRSDSVGKPLLYSTTTDFLIYFGLNDLSELPKPREIAEIMGTAEQNQEISGVIVEALTELEANQHGNNDKAE